MSIPTPEKSEAQNTKQIRIRVKYDKLEALYASQALVNASAEEIFIDFSSGVMPDPGTGDQLMAIHTRIAMSPSAAARLASTLQQTLSRGTSAQQAASPK